MPAESVILPNEDTNQIPSSIRDWLHTNGYQARVRELNEQLTTNTLCILIGEYSSRIINILRLSSYTQYIGIGEAIYGIASGPWRKQGQGPNELVAITWPNRIYLYDSQLLYIIEQYNNNLLLID